MKCVRIPLEIEEAQLKELWADSHDNFLKGLFYLEDFEFGGTKVIGSGKNQNL